MIVPRGGRRDGAGRPKKQFSELFDRAIEDLTLASEIFRRLQRSAEVRQAKLFEEVMRKCSSAYQLQTEIHADLGSLRANGQMFTPQYQRIRDDVERLDSELSHESRAYKELSKREKHLKALGPADDARRAKLEAELKDMARQRDMLEARCAKYALLNEKQEQLALLENQGKKYTQRFREAPEESQECGIDLRKDLEQNGRPTTPAPSRRNGELDQIFRGVSEHYTEAWSKRVGVGRVKNCWHKLSPIFLDPSRTDPDI